MTICRICGSTLPSPSSVANPCRQLLTHVATGCPIRGAIRMSDFRATVAVIAPASRQTLFAMRDVSTLESGPPAFYRRIENSRSREERSADKGRRRVPESLSKKKDAGGSAGDDSLNDLGDLVDQRNPSTGSRFDSPSQGRFVANRHPAGLDVDVLKGLGLGRADGEGGIRTHGSLARTQHFQCCTIGRSVTSP
jgi:hypothetical protein